MQLLDEADRQTSFVQKNLQHDFDDDEEDRISDDKDEVVCATAWLVLQFRKIYHHQRGDYTNNRLSQFPPNLTVQQYGMYISVPFFLQSSNRKPKFSSLVSNWGGMKTRPKCN